VEEQRADERDESGPVKEIDCPELGTKLVLYQPTYTKRGEKKTAKSWWVRYRWEGEPRFHNLKAKQYNAALIRLAEFRKKLASKIAGVEDPFEAWRDLAIATHVEHFETTLRSSGVTAKHLDERVGYVKTFIAESKVRKLVDLDVAKASAWFAELLASCETARYGNKGLSARSINKRRAALVQFGKWLFDVRRIADNPFRTLKKLNERVDRRHKRRALTDAELKKLLEVAARRALEEKSRNQWCTKVVTSDTLALVRTIVYAWLNRGGPRENEARTLRVGDLDLVNGWAKIPAERVKTQDDRVIAIHASLVPLFKRLVEGAKASALVFPQGSFPTLAKWKSDLAAAGIAYEDEQHRRADMHAGRRKLSGDLQRAGATVKDTAFLMGHSEDGKTTLAHYSDAAELPVLKRLVDALPLELPEALTRIPSSETASALVRKVVSPPNPLADPKGLTSSLESRSEAEPTTNDEARESLILAGFSDCARPDSNRQPSASEAGSLQATQDAREASAREASTAETRPAPGAENARLVRKVVSGGQDLDALEDELLELAGEVSDAEAAQLVRALKVVRAQRRRAADESDGKVLRLGS
jgi:site-specific recombinase XerD